MKKNTHTLLPHETVIQKIYVVRGHRIMLDEDLAQLYQIETKRLNEQVRRNLYRFPKDFMFQLNKDEFENLKSQFASSSWGGRRKLPLAFTEQGVAMLSGIINSEKAVSMNIAIMRAFVEIRKVIINNKAIAEKLQMLSDKIGEHDVQLNSIYAAIENLLDDKIDKDLKEAGWNKRRRIGFKSDT